MVQPGESSLRIEIEDDRSAVITGELHQLAGVRHRLERRGRIALGQRLVRALRLLDLDHGRRNRGRRRLGLFVFATACGEQGCGAEQDESRCHANEP